MRLLLLYVGLSLSFLPVMAQPGTVQDDFEGSGTITSWFGDDCGIDVAAVNPFSQGLNTSATVLAYTDSGGSYANVGFDISSSFDLSTSATFSVMVYVPANGLTGNHPNQISLKLQDGSLPQPWTTQSEVIKPLSLDEWQVITFDFATDPYINLDPTSADPVTRTDFSRVLFQINGENNQDHVVAYLDEVRFEGSVDTIGTGPGPSFTELVWADEFDGTGSPDPTKWYHQTLLPDGVNWYNGEVQHYTDRIENSYLQDGALHIAAKKETFTDQGQTKSYTSARLNSKFAFTYGRVEIRAKLPIGLGTWPAIWMLGQNIDEPGGYWTPQFGTVPWPACGEIDIMEHWGYNQNYVQSALHTPSSFGGTVNHGGVVANDVANVFHVYAVEWSAEKMDFSLDGNVFYTYAPDTRNADTWPFDANQYLLLNIAMVGAIDPAFSESEMVIDYIRVYQEATNSVADAELAAVSMFPNPVTNELKITLPEQLREATVEVFSPSGQKVSTQVQAGPELTLDWSSQPQGLYLVTVTTDKGQRSFKVVKQ